MPAQAQRICDPMLMPATQLKQVSRGLSSFHSGLDLTAPYGSPVRAAAAGEVVFRGSYFGYGNMIDLRHEDGVVTRYAHLSSFAPGLRVGMLVGGGVQIGTVGTSGHAHGAHLHFEVRVNGRPVDPKDALALGPRQPLAAAGCRFDPHAPTRPAPADSIEQAQAPEPRRSEKPH